MKTLFCILLIFMAVFLTSCDCIQPASGIVLDAETNLPIQGVQVHKENKEVDNDLTDAEGVFGFASISGGFRTCPPMTIVLKKEGYKTRSVNLGEEESDTLKLWKAQ